MKKYRFIVPYVSYNIIVHILANSESEAWCMMKENEYHEEGRTQLENILEVL